MKNTFLLFLVLLISVGTYAQEKKLHVRRDLNTSYNQNQNNENIGEAQQTVIDKRPKPPITDYKIISITGDTTHVDTTLTIQKAYRYNYLRKDNFGLLPFSNVGQSYTQLTRAFDKVSTLPKFGARAAHYAYLGVDDIYYYHVPTPWTELFFKTTFKQGQLLDATFTSNISPEFNFSIAYKGLHSLGKYQHIMTSQGSFRTTVSYQSKNKRYVLHAHFVAQDLSAEQNGGLTDLSNQQFASQSGEYSNRDVLDVNYKDGEGFLRAKRFFVKHHYALIKGNDSTKNNQLQIGHIFNFTDQEYRFTQGQPFKDYGASYQNSNIVDFTEFQEISNTAYAQYYNKTLGKFLFKARLTNYNYGYHRTLNLSSGIIPNRLKGNEVSVGASYQKKIGGFELSGDAMLNTVGDFNGNYLRARASYAIDSLTRIEAGILTNSRQPNYNFILYQSAYKNYNWYNDFENVQKQQLHVALKSTKIADLAVDFTRIHNYAYFGLRKNPKTGVAADTLITPYQYSGDVNYFRIKASKEFHMGSFSFANTLMYQKVVKGEEVLHVAPFITRNSLYYHDYWFHNNLFLQTGFTYNYFSSFKADGYDPVMAESYVQNDITLQGFSRLDFFFNAKVDKARLYFKVENLTTFLDGNGHYAAPYQPYRDWSIRFGIVWDFFL